MSHEPGLAALIVDVDGVVSPIGGRTAWGDDVIAGDVFGPVLVSPTLCRRLDLLATRPHLVTCWLTSWPPHLRATMHPFPGRRWPEIASHPDDPDLGWWKWSALSRWLDTHTRVRRLAWCDDQLNDDQLNDDYVLETDAQADRPHPPDPGADGTSRPGVIRDELARRGIESLTLAPQLTVGLTPQDLKRVERFLLPRWPP